MKSTLKHSLFALAGFTASVAPVMGSDDFAAGDIGLAFYAVTDNVVEADTYVVNLGQASLYRENTKSNLPLSAINAALASSNIGADLVATFGADWAEGGRVQWAVVGGVRPLDPLTGGDTARTFYVSRARTALATGATGAASAAFTVTSTQRGFFSNALDGFFSGTNNGIGMLNSNTSTSGINAAGVILPISNINSFEDFVPPSINGTYFGIGIDPRQTFAVGPIPGGAGVEGALDLYRVLHSATGADLTVGATAGASTVGASQFIGTLTIDGAGNLKMAAIGATTNPDTDSDGMTDAWEMTNFGNLTQGPNDDFDNDGTNNLTEFRLGLDPKSSTSRFAASLTGPASIQWPSVAGVTFIVQRSTTLLPGSWGNDVTVPGTAGTASYTDPAPPAGKAFYRVLLQP